MDILMVSLGVCFIVAVVMLCINIIRWTNAFDNNDDFSHHGRTYKASKTVATLNEFRLFPWLINK